MFKKTLWLSLLVVLILLPTAVLAQTLTEAQIIDLNPSAFPFVTGHLDIKSDSPQFFSELKNPNVTIIENGSRILVDDLKIEGPGTQFVVGISPSTAFNIRDSQGTSRFEYLMGSLSTWAQLLAPSSQDAVTLLAPEGSLLSEEENPAALGEALSSYQPNFESAAPNLDILSRAVDMAANTPPRAGMGRAVLFITSTPTDETVEVIRGISDRALAQDVMVMVWLVDSSVNFDLPGAAALRELADLSGGILYTFSGIEPLPEIDVYLEPLRYVYTFSYFSTLTAAGTFPIAAEIQYGETTILSESFDLDVLVQPPSPIIIDPPVEINRTFLSDYETSIEDLRPLEQKLEILIEFGDQIEREIIRTGLYINGELAAENIEEPFNQFTWDISEISESDTYSLRFEAEDSFGLIGTSIETPVGVNVQIPPDNLRIFLDRYGTALVIIVLAAAAGILLLSLFISGRISPKPIVAGVNRQKSKNDPVTQPLESSSKPFRFPKAVEKKQTTALFESFDNKRDELLASLTALPEQEHSPPAAKFFIHQVLSKIGSSPEMDFSIEDSTISSSHASLRAEQNQIFTITDSGSAAGTYVNYLPVGPQGRQLQHGDTVHFGYFGYRFEIENPATIREISIVKRTGHDSER